MSSVGAADEWDVIVPADAEQLMAELRRHGVYTGQRLHVIAGARDAGPGETWPPPWIGSFDSDEPNLGERSEEILRAEFGGS
jgi:hypothetical protein